jgi:hypothetical protein
VADRETVTAYVADTHAVFWYLTGSSRLGDAARDAFRAAAAGSGVVPTAW